MALQAGAAAGRRAADPGCAERRPGADPAAAVAATSGAGAHHEGSER